MLRAGKRAKREKLTFSECRLRNWKPVLEDQRNISMATVGQIFVVVFKMELG